MTMSGLTQTGSALPLKLIAGLGNPGAEYANTRHNAGAWFVERLAEKFGTSLKPETKFFGRTSLINVDGVGVRLLIPDTYMNESGKSVGALVNFFKIEPAGILIAHDEIDFPPGKIRFKQEGGMAGHNGLRDISSRLAGATDFKRLRIGVGHPGDRGGVTGHVLGKVTRDDHELIGNCIGDAIAAIPCAVTGNWQLAMQQLHNV
jgi:PTH1 family peptidyl-tRNA hydrolase